MMRLPLWTFVVLAGSSLLLVLAGLLAELYPLRLIGGLLLAGFVPGYGLLRLMPIRSSLSWLVHGLAALAASYAITVVLLMGLTYVAGVITLAGVLIGFGLGLAALAGMTWRGCLSSASEEIEEARSPLFVLGLFLLVALATFLRVWGNQYSDLQGDEAEILFRAASLLLGTENSLVTHSKGPAEILVVAALAVLTGRLDEFTVRLPFAIASVGGVAGVAMLGRRMFGPIAGLVAGGLLAINGVLVTYARTAQYQSLMFLFSVWAAWFFFAYFKQGRSGALWLGTFLLSAAFLTHFEAVLVVPLPVFLIWRRWTRGEMSMRQQWPVLAGAATLAGFIVAAFYLPALLNPQARETGSYLAQRVGSAFPHNNFPLLYISSLTYNAAYYLMLSAGLLSMALLIAFRRMWRWNQALFFLALLILLGLSLVLGRLVPAVQPTYLLILSIIGSVVLAFGNRLTDQVRGLLIWGAPAWLIYLFLVVRPGNHYYVFFPAAALLSSWGVAKVLGRLTLQTGVMHGLAKGALGLILLAGFLVCAYYQYLLVVRNDLEYILTYPQSRHPFFVTDARFPFGTRIGFGFPYRLGWQMVSHLYRTGELTGDWGGNDAGNTPDWYTLGTTRTDCYPRNVILGEITYKEDYDPLPFDLEASGYRLRYRVLGNGRLRMRIFTFDPLEELNAPQDLIEPAWYPMPMTLERLESLAMQRQQNLTHLTPAVGFSLSEEVKAQLAEVFDPRLTQVRDRVQLVGYQIDQVWARSGGAVPVTLYWQAVESMHLPLKVFVHLAGDQVTVQADDFPVCGTFPMPRWKVGQIVADRHLIQLPTDMAPGSYRLEVGIYEPQTGLRMDTLDVTGNPAGNSLHLADIAIQANN